MRYVYAAHLEPEEDGGYLVTFPDVPSAITQGDDRADALTSASEALGLALRGVLARGNPLPEPAASDGVPVAVAPDTALKLAVIESFAAAGISKTELARRLGRHETEARRILDPHYPTRGDLLADALVALGKQVVIEVRDAA